MVKWCCTLSHALYGGIGIVANGYQFDDLGPAAISFTVLIARSLLGIVNGLTNGENEDVKKVYNFVDQITWFFAFPLYACHLWLKHGVKPEIAWIHPAVALIPFGLYLAEKEYEDASSALMLGNTISAAYVTIIHENWFALGATVVFAITHGVIKVETDNDSMEKEDMFNLLLAVYMLLAWHGLGGSAAA